MASSPAKRRKTSPTVVDARDATPAATPPQPQKSPATESRSLPRRPSFASPTKASIARHNPQLLNRARSTSMSPTKPHKETQPDVETTKPSLFVSQIPISPSRPKSRGGATQENTTARLSPSAALRETTPTPGSQAQRRQSRSPGRGNQDTPRRSPRTKPENRARDRPETIHQSGGPGEVIDRTGQRAANRTGNTGYQRVLDVGNAPAPTRAEREEEEQDLPPTPSQRGIPDPKAATPPSGIHTPSKRTRKKPKTSPLKQRADAGDGSPKISLPSRPVPQSRFGALEDPLAEKRQLKDQLAEEIRLLKTDIQLAERESERLRQLHRAGRNDTLEPPNSEEILALLLRAVPRQDTVKPKPKISLIQNIGAFLPFGARPRASKATVSLRESTPASHLPIFMEKPLPYLQIFTPLEFASTIQVVPAPANSPSYSPIQLHNISVRSPTGLFNARVDISVSTETFAVLSLAIPKLDPAAEAEYGSWARSRASKRSVLGRDVHTVFWAMSRWTETAKRRAAFWCSVEQEFGTPRAVQQSITKLKSKVQLQVKQRKRKLQAVAQEEQRGVAKSRETSVGDNIASVEDYVSKWKRKDLLPHMGRNAMSILFPDDIELHLSWVIGFDWTGETESTIQARARVPQSWHNIDDRKSLPRIPDLFNRLVAEKGVMEAVRAVVLLLSGVEFS